MGRVIDTTNQPTTYELKTQTPKNYSLDNYFLNELQEKVWADWEYRPNRADVEQETGVGTEQYFPLEVVVQNIKNDKGEKVSDDYKRLVFREINYKMRLGGRFRFSFDFDLEQPDEEKSVWLVTNRDSTTPTSSVVVTRCNGTLGSIWVDKDGKSHYHYEPCISTNKISGVNFHYASEIIVQQSQIILIVQHNQYTRDYQVNQRFILGYDKVYKVKGMDKFNSLTTYNPEDVDMIVLYAEIDEIASEDDFEHRIAFNNSSLPPVEKEPEIVGDLAFKITKPSPLPTDLYSAPVLFEVGLYNGENLLDIPVQVTAELDGTATPEAYYELLIVDGNSFTVRRRKIYTRSTLLVTCSVAAEDSPTGEAFSETIELGLKERE